MYPKPVSLGAHTLRLHPASHAKAHVETYHLGCEQAERIQWTIDPYGNKVARISFPWDERFRELDILVELVVEVRSVNPFDFFVDHRVEELGFTYPAEYALELAPFLGLDDPAFACGEQFETFLAEMPDEGRTVDAIVQMNALVNRRIDYVIREEPGVWTPEETLAQGRGSCRDSAMLLVALLRRRGIAARFVSGYLIQVTDEGMLPDLPKGLDHDVVDLHAWAEAYVPGAGWIGLDATSGLMATEGHIPLACASTPTLAAPLYGSAEMAAEQVDFRMSVARLGHEPRPTAPYTDEVWARLRESGRRADEGPQRWVAVDPFWLGKCEVTWDEYEQWSANLERARRPEDQQPNPADGAADAVSRPTPPYTDMTFGMGKEGFPAICMTQHAAIKYSEWLSAKLDAYYRLPTEAEWEWACRAGTTTAFSFGDDPAGLGAHAWHKGNSDGRYQKVGLKQPNPWGLHDMHGNVSEWCLDMPTPYAPTETLLLNPWVAPTEEYPRAVRGGSWKEREARLRSAARRGSASEWKMKDPQIPQSIWYFTDAQFNGFRVLRPYVVPSAAERKQFESNVVDQGR